MRSYGGVSALNRQIVALQNLLPKMDSEWETLTSYIQADQQRLTVLEEWQQEFTLLLRAEPERVTPSTLALIGQLDMVERQIRQVADEIAHKQLLRRALEQRFDEVRLALRALRQREAGIL